MAEIVDFTAQKYPKPIQLIKLIIKGTIYCPLPDLNLGYDELKDLTEKLLSNNSSFNVIEPTNKIAEYVKVNRVGIKIYKQSILVDYPKRRLREIIWNFIIDRHIIRGENGHDTGLTLTIT